MDIDALHSALVSLTVCPEQVRSARENFTAANGDAPSSLGDFLDSLERDLRVAKATLARERGLNLCRCCWPPELLVSDRKGRAYCPSSPDGTTLFGDDSWIVDVQAHPPTNLPNPASHVEDGQLLIMTPAAN